VSCCNDSNDGSQPSEPAKSAYLGIGYPTILNGFHTTQDVSPELDNVLIIAVRRRLNLPRRAIQELAAPEDIEPLTLEVLETESFGTFVGKYPTSSPLRAGQQARIIEVAGLTLWVEPQSNPKE